VISGQWRGAGGVPAQPFPTQTTTATKAPGRPTGRPCVGPPVTLSNGNMFHSFEDLRFPGQGLPIALTRTYNSQLPHDGRLGFGWTHSTHVAEHQLFGRDLYRGTALSSPLCPKQRLVCVAALVDDTLSPGGSARAAQERRPRISVSGNGHDRIVVAMGTKSGQLRHAGGSQPAGTQPA